MTVKFKQMFELDFLLQPINHMLTKINNRSNRLPNLGPRIVYGDGLNFQN